MDDLFNTTYRTIVSRLDANSADSYVARLSTKGRSRIAQKTGEEAVETVIAACLDDREAVVQESTDLLFHLMILWANMNITPEEIAQEFYKRQGTSGLVEKAHRS